MSAHDSPDGNEPCPDPSFSHLHDQHLDQFLRSINMHGALSESAYSMSSSATPSSHPVQIPLPDPPVIVPSHPLPVIENQPIYLQSVYPDPPSPREHEYGTSDYSLGSWQQQQSPRTVQFSFPNSAHSDEHSWQTAPQSYTHTEAALRRPSGPSGEYHSPHYQTTPSPAADLSPLPLTPGGVARSATSRATRAAHAAPYDPSSRRVSAPSAHHIAEGVMQPKLRTPSPARMPPPVAVPQRTAPMTTRKRSRAGTGGETAGNTGRSRKAVASNQTQVASSSSTSGSLMKYPSQLQISSPSTTSPTYAPSPTFPTYASHSPVQSSPLVSAPVILPPQTLSPTTAPRQDSSVHPHSEPADNTPSPMSSRFPAAVDSLLMSTHPAPAVAVNSSFSSSSGSISSSVIPSSISSLSSSTSSSSNPSTIPIEARRVPQEVHVRPQRQSQRPQLRQPSSSATPSLRGAPYPQSASARFAYQQATKSARATYLKHLTALNFLTAEALLPSEDPQARQVRHTAHHPLAPWLTSDINTAEHIPADMRYDANSHILSAVLAVPGIEEDKIAVTLEDVHFNRNRVLYVSAFTSSTFPWHEDDLRMAQHSEVVGTIADAEEKLRNKDDIGEGKAREVGANPHLASDGDKPPSGDASSGSTSDAYDAHESAQGLSSTSNVDAQPPTSTTPTSQPIRMGHMPNIRELLYGRQVRVINVPPSTQPKDVTVTLLRGLLYIDVDMGEPLTMETATRNFIPIASS